ncbi:hypothetical protein CPT_Palo_007 [Rhizobium phage Palo]|uniref:Uncharacterized protein n=1 Tax=Rhizobium phage Palo TaxID=2767573 RepID=A0A7L8G4H9_9CAUD|nr:hypothetical protein CPT_Palo_007 [Rhizobium phage Palo]
MKPHDQSELLTMFYNQYSLWILNGAPESITVPFSRKQGLCDNLYFFIREQEMHLRDFSACKEMTRQFELAGLNYNLPFNRSLDDLFAEGKRMECHLNRQRTQWALQHSTLIHH